MINNEPQKTYKTGLALVQHMKAFYGSYSVDDIENIGDLYTQDIEFVDPIEVTHGLFALKHYLRKQSLGLNYSSFHYLNEIVGENQAFIRWEMVFSHPKLAKGREVVLPGMTEIKFTQKIYYQCDSYDLGAMVYEHVPFLGGTIRYLKNRLRA